MYNKKVKSILFIFLILFCIAAVNAESIDDAGADIQSVAVANVESVPITSPIADEPVSVGDFSDLNTTINGNDNSTVSLDKNYVYNNTADGNFKEGITINRTLTIDGQGHTVDGNHTARIFNVINGATLTLKNINLINGNATNGGAIYNDEGHVNVVNSTFAHNTAEKGGAIYVELGDMTITGSSFINNTATANGGAIYSDIGYMDVVSSNFTNNSAVDGGAIYNNGDMNVTNSIFTQNSAKDSAGAIYSEMGDMDVTDSVFSLNTAVNGGAIYSLLGEMNIFSSTFSKNSATSGGAIYSALDDMNVADSKFENNTAINSGGAIYNNGKLDVMDSVFTLNTANDGGAIHTEIGDMNIISSTFTLNNATQYGGAIYSDVGDLNVMDSKFMENSATVSGGAIFNNGFLDVIDSEFNANTAPAGGAIFNDGDINVTNSNFTKNTANDGGAINSKIGHLNIVDSKFTENTAANGGAVYNTGDMDVMNSAFTQNNGVNGGAIYTIDGNATVIESEFTANNATNGGAIYYTNTASTSPDVSLTVMNSNFNDNTGDFGDDIYTTYKTNVLNNVYTKDSYANIYANNTIIDGTVIVVLKNSTYFVPNAASKFVVNATAFVDGASIAGYDLVITDGEKTYNTTYLGNGVYQINENITANFTIKTYSAIVNNDTNFTNYEVEMGTVVNLKEINLEVQNLTKYYGEAKGLNIILTDINGNPIANQEVTITINGRTYTRTTDANGKVLMNINLIPGVYDVTVSYGDIVKNATVTVLSTVAGSDIVKYYRNGTQYYATFYGIDGKPLANTNVTFNINGVFYTRTTDENGTARLNINLNPAEYIITAINPVSNQTYSNAITVLSTISGNDVVKYFRNGTQYYATFVDGNGNPLANRDVTFNINGVFYTRTTDEKGIAKLSINLNPGEYIITAINPENGETYSNNVRVLSTIETQNLEMYTFNRKAFNATILDDQGNPLANAKVTFNINGVFYTRTTDANGVASLNINLIAGEYIISTMYNGLTVANKVVVM